MSDERESQPATGRQPRAGATITTSISMSRELHQKIKAAAKASDTNVSTFLRQAGRRALAASGAPDESGD